MGETGEGVFGERHLRGLAPGGVRAVGAHYLGIAGVGGVARALCEVHLALVGREAAGALVVFGVQSALYLLRLEPLALVVFLREEDVAGLGTGYAAQLVAHRLVAGGAEVEVFILVAEEHGRVVGAAGVEDVHLLHRVARALLLPLGGHAGRAQTLCGQVVAGKGVEHDFKLRSRLLVVAVLQQLAGYPHVGHGVVLLVSYHIAVGGYRLLRGTGLLVAEGHFAGYLAAFRLVLGRCLAVGCLEFVGSIIVFAQGQVFLAPFQVSVGPAGHKKQCQGQCPDGVDILLQLHVNVDGACARLIYNVCGPLLLYLFSDTFPRLPRRLMQGSFFVKNSGKRQIFV